ncbi:MAG: hypothetical protein U9M90_03490 [Patescibacteria group bacterium]|nr:hypothetical protein [Patescibacteria group bacterium]
MREKATSETFYRGQLAIVMDMESGKKVPCIVFSVNEAIVVRSMNRNIELVFDKETLKGETIFGSCALAHKKIR